MNYEAYQPMLVANQGDLLLPKLRGVITQNVEERVVLRAGHGKLDDVSDKVWHHRAAAATLRIEMCHVGNRHVIGELESVVPVCVTVEDTGAKPLGAVFPCVFVDALRTAQELRMIGI